MTVTFIDRVWVIEVQEQTENPFFSFLFFFKSWVGSKQRTGSSLLGFAQRYSQAKECQENKNQPPNRVPE